MSYIVHGNNKTAWNEFQYSWVHIFFHGLGAWPFGPLDPPLVNGRQFSSLFLFAALAYSVCALIITVYFCLLYRINKKISLCVEMVQCCTELTANAKSRWHKTETVVAITIPTCSKSRSTTGSCTSGINDEDIDVLFTSRLLRGALFSVRAPSRCVVRHYQSAWPCWYHRHNGISANPQSNERRKQMTTLNSPVNDRPIRSICWVYWR